MPRASLLSSLILVVALGVATLLAWWWRREVIRGPQRYVITESWERVKEAYPLPVEASESAKLSAQTIEDVVRANPFSSKRRLAIQATSPDQPGAVAIPPEPPKPQFVYKGHVDLGTHHRAIVEDVTTHKTYFLEVGQAVAGFKVLDISETQVLLSNDQTHEEVRASLTSRSSAASASPTAAASLPAKAPVRPSNNTTSETSSLKTGHAE